MAAEMALARSLIRRAETTELSLASLEAIAEIRRHLDVLEVEALRSAREKGATVDDIAEAMGLTPQAIYHRLRHGGQVTRRGRPKSSGAHLAEGASSPAEPSGAPGVGSPAAG